MQKILCTIRDVCGGRADHLNDILMFPQVGHDLNFWQQWLKWLQVHSFAHSFDCDDLLFRIPIKNPFENDSKLSRTKDFFLICNNFNYEFKEQIELSYRIVVYDLRKYFTKLNIRFWDF